MTKTYQSHEIEAQVMLCETIALLSDAHARADVIVKPILLEEIKRLHETPIIIHTPLSLCTCPNDIALGCAPKPDHALEWQDLGLTPTGDIA